MNLSLFLLLLAWPLLGMAQTDAERIQAIGSLKHLGGVMSLAFTPDPAFFQPLGRPGPGDWLAEHPERGQTFDAYRAALDAYRPGAQQRKLAILPLGDFAAPAPTLEKLRDYCSAFFTFETKLLPSVPLKQVPAKQRLNDSTQKPQLLTLDALRWLDTQKPADCYAVLAVTMTDLYPDETWNFVFGQANTVGGTGVFSFARYDPAFFGDDRDEATAQLVLERSLKVLAHEMGHMFGLKHCIYYRCLLNGSNHMTESDAQPQHLCPVCLRKLHLSTACDLLQRERALLKFYQAEGMTDEANWSQRRVAAFELHK